MDRRSLTFKRTDQMIRTMLLAGAALAAATPASAQVVPSVQPYIGVFAGHSTTKPDYFEPDYANYERNPSMKGLNAGGLVGLRFAAMGLELGAEADLGALDNDAAADATSTTNSYTAFDSKWNAHLRARAGIGAGPVDLFVAGGLARLKMVVDDTDTDYGELKISYRGWTLGGGVETRVMGKLGVRAEYLHDRYNSASDRMTYLGTDQYLTVTRPRTNTVRAAAFLTF